jgi:hypothetical protein
MSLFYPLYRVVVWHDRGETRLILVAHYLDHNHLKTIKIVEGIDLINKEIHIKKQIILRHYICRCINITLASDRSERVQSGRLQIRIFLGVFTPLLVTDCPPKCQDNNLVLERVNNGKG